MFWDILASMDVCAEQARDGLSWHSTLLIPEARRLRPSQEKCWREDGFEWLLTWVNDELAPAAHLALYGGERWVTCPVRKASFEQWPVAGTSLALSHASLADSLE